MNRFATPGKDLGDAHDGEPPNVFTPLRAAGILPVVTVTHARQAVGIAQALVDGGIPFIEITFRTEAASAAIAAVHQDVPITIAAGSLMFVPRGTGRKRDPCPASHDRHRRRG